MALQDVPQTFDEDLRQAVLAALEQDQLTASLDLRVGVLNAVVHLGGTAASQEQWYRAEQIAAEFPGVRGVVNRIEAPDAPNPSRTIHLDLTSGSNKGEINEEQL